MNMSVFCAGKIHSHNHQEDWRYALLGEEQDFFFDDPKKYRDNPTGFGLRMVTGDTFVGPFAIDGLGGHGSGHGTIESRHGVETPRLVVADCQNRIRKCDVVFAWLDSEDCYGTLVEIGYAKALGKPILIGIDSKSPIRQGDEHIETWYAQTCANHICASSNALDAFLELRLIFLAEERRLFRQTGLVECIWCGGQAEIVRVNNSDVMHKFGRCTQCGATSGGDDSYAGAHDSWNFGVIEYPGTYPAGMVNYKRYIQSQEWREKAEEAKERAGQRCQVCNRPRSEVTLDAHHRTYDRLGNELPEDITVLCRLCHELYESNKKQLRGGR